MDHAVPYIEAHGHAGAAHGGRQVAGIIQQHLAFPHLNERRRQACHIRMDG